MNFLESQHFISGFDYFICNSIAQPCGTFYIFIYIIYIFSKYSSLTKISIIWTFIPPVGDHYWLAHCRHHSIVIGEYSSYVSTDYTWHIYRSGVFMLKLPSLGWGNFQVASCCMVRTSYPCGTFRWCILHCIFRRKHTLASYTVLPFDTMEH